VGATYPFQTCVSPDYDGAALCCGLSAAEQRINDGRERELEWILTQFYEFEDNHIALATPTRILISSRRTTGTTASVSPTGLRNFFYNAHRNYRGILIVFFPIHNI